MDENISPVSTQETLNPKTLAKPKKPPPVTPRRFRKFFTPRSTRQGSSAVRTSRKALQDITKPALNRKLEGQTIASFAEDTEIQEGNEPFRSKKRKLSISSVDHVPQSSPLRRVTSTPLSSQENDPQEISRNTSRCQGDFEKLDHSVESTLSQPKIRTYKNFGTSAAILASRIGAQNPRRKPNFHTNHEAETADFFSSSQDVYFCDSGGTGSSYTIPFCTASCNTNSLIAIGDEEGGVRLIDSSKEDRVGFSKPFLSLRPHDNAVMDLCFSNDDALLATASGDQTSLIIDMPTQKTIAALAGHESSIKQVRFQPGSNDKVLATCGRDGSAFVWDLRCHDSEPAQRMLSKGYGRHPDSDDTVRYPSIVNKIRQAHRFPLTPQNMLTSASALPSLSSAKRPQHHHHPGGEISVTSLTFLPPTRSHLFLTASSTTSHIKLWDLRTTYTTRRSNSSGLPPQPLSTTRLPPSHQSLRGRNYGLTSLVLDSSSSRLYASCRDHAVYAYNTSHLVLGSASDLTLPTSTATHNPPARRFGSSSGNGNPQEGLSPLFALRHPRLRISSFYIKLSLRHPSHSNDYSSELLAIGSSDNCAVLFPTSPEYLVPRYRKPNTVADTRVEMGGGVSPTFTYGTPLIEGHKKEVTSVTWTYGGDLVSVGDDFLGRCWRKGDRRGSEARGLRGARTDPGKRWLAGWADVGEEWDDEDD